MSVEKCAKMYATDRISIVCTLLAVGCLAVAADAGVQTFLSIGDSITFGEGSTTLNSAPNTPEYRTFIDKHFEGTTRNYTSAYGSTYWTSQGYRYYLQQRMNATGVGYDFVGNRGSGQAGLDPDHWGNPGTKLYTSRVRSSYQQPFTSINDALLNVTRDTFSIDNYTYDISDKNHGQVAFNPATSQPKRILFHGGTNDINSGNPAEAIGGFNHTLRTMFDMYHDEVFTNKPLFFIAKIIPKGRGNIEATTVYNNHIANVINKWSRSKNEQKNTFASRISVVDMERIEMATLDLNWLSFEFGHSVGDLDVMLDIDGDGVLDWFDDDDYNANVLSSDDIHPNDLGYAVMANVWSNTIPVIAKRYARIWETAPTPVVTSLSSSSLFSTAPAIASFTTLDSVAIPEPATLSLILLATPLLLRRGQQG